MKIAVIGAGIYGITVANVLARAGHKVDLFEKNNDILTAASGINQYRLHRGHHYPRSSETIETSIKSDPSFREEYGEAIISDTEHYYCVAKENSLISGAKYLATCDKHGLVYERANLDILNKDAIEICVKVHEAIIDPIRLREVCLRKIKEESGVKLFLNTYATEKHVTDHDLVVLCAYATQNEFLEKFSVPEREYQFEICEKLVVELPQEFRKKSVVVVDGPFMCIDPYASTNFHVMGNVVYANHAGNIGKHPIVPENLKKFLNNGIIKNPPITNFQKFINSATYFMPKIAEAKHIGSMFTIRTVLPYKEKTDTRPTVIDFYGDKIISIFSGKFGNCVEAAREVLDYLSKFKEKK